MCAVYAGRASPARVPALDNGEWMWALAGAGRSLAAAGEGGLGARYDGLFRTLAGNAKAVFYNGSGVVRAVTRILNASAGVVVPGNYVSDGEGVLNDPVRARRRGRRGQQQ